MSTSDTPLALVGYPSAAALALRDLGLTALSVPAADPEEVVQACRVLGFGGALIAPAQQAAWLGAVSPDPEARRAGRVDAVTFGGVTPQGTFAYADALSDALSSSDYAARGAALLVLGQHVGDLLLAAPLTRLGFARIALAAHSAPEAEKALRDLPVGPRYFPVSRRDGSVQALAERSDLVVLTSGELPPRLLQPYHTLLDLTGQARPGASGATVLDLEHLGAHHLIRQLSHATGQRLHPPEVAGAARALRAGVQ